jgi:hypothetical protein
MAGRRAVTAVSAAAGRELAEADRAEVRTLATRLLLDRAAAQVPACQVPAAREEMVRNRDSTQAVLAAVAVVVVTS